jgi:hypothetical protein
MTHITIWPNGLGADVTSGRIHLEVWEHGGIARMVPDRSPTGLAATHHTTVPKAPLETMAHAAIEAWKSDRSRWLACDE